METGPHFIVSCDRQKKPGIEPVTPGLQGLRHNHCAIEASNNWFYNFYGKLLVLLSKPGFCHVFLGNLN